MKKTVLIFVINLLLVCISVKAFSQAGALDTTFNNTGIRLYDHGTVHDNGYGLVALSDTTAVVLGNAEFNGSLAGVLFRIKQNSDIDSTFGVDNGYTEIQVGNQTFPRELLEQPDGKYLVAGTVQTSGPLNESFFVARYLTDGSPDLSFNSTGYWTSDYSTELENCESIALQPDGKIILAGRTYQGSFSQLLFTRVKSDGTLDASFGTNGYTEINGSTQDEEISALGVLSNGTIVGVGDAYQGNPMWGHQVIMAKLDAHGNPITSFGGDGVIIPPIITDISTAFSMVIQNDDIYMSGYQYDASNNAELYITKMDSSGIADPSFGTNGIVLTKINGNGWNVGLDILLGDDGKIYNSGTTGANAMATEFLLIRYLSDGAFDTSFDGDGYVSTDIRSDWDEATALVMQVDGKILMTGTSGGLTNSGENKLPIARYLNDFIPFGADFTASETYICDGSTVTFTDQSNGNIISWNWSFEGGSPATSTAQSPMVTYNTTGIYDVQLVITDGTNYDTLLRQDYIEVVTTPGQASTPVGGTNACAGSNINYTTNSVQYATSYQWEVDPPDAGNMSGTDTIATFESSSTYSGSYNIKVRALNICGTGPWSPDFQGNLVASPQAFTLQGDGAWCEGSQGAELTLDGSETGVDYELYLDDVATGNIVAGTGSSISFGYVTDEGIYTAVGSDSGCETDMYGQIWVHMVGIPAQAGTPEGPEQICNDTTTTYTTTGASDADTLIWMLDPVDAGILTPNGQEASIEWSVDFSGIALLSVTGENDCGTGDPSDNLEIEVFATPRPVISGDTFTCQYYQGIVYTTANNPDNTYTWEISGGTIASGAGTHEVSVDWGAPGQGWLRVTEESPEECISTTEDYMVTIDECVGIEEFTLESIHIYPNPANDHINIEVPADFREEFMIRIMDLAGRSVALYHETPLIGKIRINISNLKEGIYAIELSNAELGKITNRIVKK